MALLIASRTIVILYFFYVLVASYERQEFALGTCYRIRYRKGSYCGKPLRTGVTQGKCCGSGRHRRSWSTELYPKGQFNGSSYKGEKAFKYQFRDLRDIHTRSPLHCHPCSNSCNDVKCGEDEKCVLRKSLPKCVCDPKCHLQQMAPVCGTDGRTYRSECHLLKRACRKRKKLRVKHSGKCQSCFGVKCGTKKSCVLNELLMPKCMRCPLPCDLSQHSNSTKKSFCGTDNVTYTSKCQTKMASCKAGVIIGRAYKGPCFKEAACENIRCWQGERCLSDPQTSTPRCEWCGILHYCRHTTPRVCASDGNIYESWCAFRMEACRSGKALTVMPPHICSKKRNKKVDGIKKTIAKCRYNAATGKNEVSDDSDLQVKKDAVSKKKNRKRQKKRKRKRKDCKKKMSKNP